MALALTTNIVVENNLTGERKIFAFPKIKVTGNPGADKLFLKLCEKYGCVGADNLQYALEDGIFRSENGDVVIYKLNS